MVLFVNLSANKEELIYNAEEIKLTIAEELHNTDAAFPMHPAVAKLVVSLYEDIIEEGNNIAMCNLGALYYTGRAGEQDYKKDYEKAFHYFLTWEQIFI